MLEKVRRLLRIIKAYLYVPLVVNVGNDDSTSLGHSYGTLSHENGVSLPSHLPEVRRLIKAEEEGLLHRALKMLNPRQGRPR